LITNC